MSNFKKGCKPIKNTKKKYRIKKLLRWKLIQKREKKAPITRKDKMSKVEAEDGIEVMVKDEARISIPTTQVMKEEKAQPEYKEKET